MSAVEHHYDRVVIGAGIIGSCTAYQLLQAGHKRVLLMDQFPLPHSRGSSHGQSRIIRTVYSDSEQSRMARRTRGLWGELERRAGETLCSDCPLLLVSPASNRALFDAFAGCLEDRTEYRGADLARLLPAARFAPDYAGCLDPSAGVLRADRCLSAVQRLFRAAGGEIQDGTPVSFVSAVPGSGGRRLRLSGRAGQPAVTCAGLVVAAGAWAGPLLAPLGLPLEPLLQPLKVDVTYWRLRPGGSVPLAGIDLGPTEDRGQHFYWLPCMEYPGMVKLCCHVGAPCDPNQRDLVSTDDLMQRTKDYVARNFPGLESEPSVIETCIYTVTPDERCILDVHPQYPNIAFAAGMSGQGFKMGPVFGEVLQRLVDGQPNEFDLSSFSLQRFNPAASRQRASL